MAYTFIYIWIITWSNANIRIRIKYRCVISTVFVLKISPTKWWITRWLSESTRNGFQPRVKRCKMDERVGGKWFSIARGAVRKSQPSHHGWMMVDVVLWLCETTHHHRETHILSYRFTQYNKIVTHKRGIRNNGLLQRVVCMVFASFCFPSCFWHGTAILFDFHGRISYCDKVQFAIRSLTGHKRTFCYLLTVCIVK